MTFGAEEERKQTYGCHSLWERLGVFGLHVLSVDCRLILRSMQSTRVWKRVLIVSTLPSVRLQQRAARMLLTAHSIYI